MDTQKKIEEKWTKAAAEYNNTVRKELKSFKATAWINLIQKHAPESKPLHILDVGTGPGFFPILLAGTGHQVTAIDSSPGMIENARKNAEEAASMSDHSKPREACLFIHVPAGGGKGAGKG